jgi:hypothetical protein
MNLTFKDSIAGAVAREVNRIANGTQPDYQQGAAYKAAWDRMGSSAMKHCQDAAEDNAIVGCLAYQREITGKAAQYYAVFEAGRGPR